GERDLGVGSSLHAGPRLATGVRDPSHRVSLNKKVSLGITTSVFALAALGVGMAVMAQKPTVLVRSAIAGEVVAEGLARGNQDVKQGDPLVYVRSTTGSRPVLAAVAPVDGRVVRVTARPGSRLNIGDIVAAIQPL